MLSGRVRSRARTKEQRENAALQARFIDVSESEAGFFFEDWADEFDLVFRITSHQQPPHPLKPSYD
jgi:hypothetical protein